MGNTAPHVAKPGPDALQQLAMVKEELSRVGLETVVVDLDSFRLKDFTWRRNTSVFLQVQLGDMLVTKSRIGTPASKYDFVWPSFTAPTWIKPKPENPTHNVQPAATTTATATSTSTDTNTSTSTDANSDPTATATATATSTSTSTSLAASAAEVKKGDQKLKLNRRVNSELEGHRSNKPISELMLNIFLCRRKIPGSSAIGKKKHGKGKGRARARARGKKRGVRNRNPSGSGSVNPSSTTTNRTAKKSTVLGYVSIPLLSMISGPQLYDHAVIGGKYPDYDPAAVVDLTHMQPRPSAGRLLGRLSFRATVKLQTEWTIQPEFMRCVFPTNALSQASDLSPASSPAASPVLQSKSGSRKRMLKNIDVPETVARRRSAPAVTSVPSSFNTAESAEFAKATIGRRFSGRASTTNAAAEDEKSSTFVALPSSSHDDSSGWSSYSYHVNYFFIMNGNQLSSARTTKTAVVNEPDDNSGDSPVSAAVWQCNRATTPIMSRMRPKHAPSKLELPTLFELASFLEVSQGGELRFQLFRHRRRSSGVISTRLVS